VFSLDAESNITALVIFDDEMPDVEFIRPDGTVLEAENLRQRSGGNFTQFFFPQASPGTWTMKYDTLSNTEITTTYSAYVEHIFIYNFDVVEHNNERISLTFGVSADDSGTVHYEIHAEFTGPDNITTDEVLITNGEGTLNQIIERQLDIAELAERGGFLIRLSVTTQNGQEPAHDIAWLDLRNW